MITKYLKKIVSLRAAVVAGLGLVVIGGMALGVSVFNTLEGQRSASAQPVAQVLKNTKVVETDVPAISGTPVRIVVPSVGIDLNVIPGYYYRSSNSWTLTLDKAQYGVMTAPANDKSGVTFIYAHYRKGVFLKLPRVQPGAIAQVTTSNGHVFTYTFRASAVTTPEDLSLFNYQGKPILVLQTCSGLWYQNRQLFTFDFTRVD